LDSLSPKNMLHFPGTKMPAN